MNITVVITSYHDRRIERTLASLAKQAQRADEVLITDGSTDEEFCKWLGALAPKHHATIVYQRQSTVASARNVALGAATGDVLAFLDTDQEAPPAWLAALTAPIERGEADWTGGPTRPTAKLDVMKLKEERLYAAARLDPTRIPMGNSAWRRKVFDKVGRFDERLSRGGEDWDLALRARSAGFRGKLVEDAWVTHDLTGVSSHWRLARKQFHYNVGGAMAYMKNRQLAGRARTRYPKVRGHWFDVVEVPLKVMAVPVAWWRLRRA